nr:uncharacterized protein LOC127328703 [Lolium perenne]
MVNREFLDVRRCIRAQFGREMRGKKMTVEALIVVGGNDGTPARWGLREVKSDRNWGTYMRFASTPGAAMYGEPMVYVQFISCDDGAGSSTGAGEEEMAIITGPSTVQSEHLALTAAGMIGQSEQAALTAGHSSGPSEQMVAQFAAEPGYWSAFVDISECVEGLPEALDDDARSSSFESSSDEEGVGPSRRAVAAPMDPEFLKTMTISNEFRSVPGLGEASLQVGQTFPYKDSADQAIKRYALAISRQHRVKQSDRRQLKVICVKLNEEGCRGRVIARVSPGVCQPWHISKIEPHSCKQLGALDKHRNVTAKYVSHIMQVAVEEDITLGTKKLQKTAEDLIGFPVSFSKARRAKEEIFQRLYGTYEEAYDLAPRLLHQIAATNQGTQVVRRVRQHPLEENQEILDRLFWAFPQTIRAFHHCRPVLSIDGTFLTGKYKGTLLVAIAADANNQLLPIAYALVGS